MIDLRFHREVYDGRAVDEAVKTYGKFGRFELVEEPAHWLVRIRAANDARERHVASELANYALGITIKNARPA